MTAGHEVQQGSAASAGCVDLTPASASHRSKQGLLWQWPSCKQHVQLDHDGLQVRA